MHLFIDGVMGYSGLLTISSYLALCIYPLTVVGVQAIPADKLSTD